MRLSAKILIVIGLLFAYGCGGSTAPCGGLGCFDGSPIKDCSKKGQVLVQVMPPSGKSWSFVSNDYSHYDVTATIRGVGGNDVPIPHWAYNAIPLAGDSPFIILIDLDTIVMEASTLTITIGYLPTQFGAPTPVYRGTVMIESGGISQDICNRFSVSMQQL